MFNSTKGIFNSVMAAVGGNNIVRYIYTGAVGERIPHATTHVAVMIDARVVLADAFFHSFNIVEVICHKNVEKIERGAFYYCPSLRRVIMPGVKVVEEYAFYECEILTDVECGKLEVIGNRAFVDCKSLISINLPSARIIGEESFCRCKALTEVEFGNKLERFEAGVFFQCRSLERITIPLRDGLINAEGISSV